jgi:hypothetical protein
MIWPSSVIMALIDVFDSGRRLRSYVRPRLSATVSLRIRPRAVAVRIASACSWSSSRKRSTTRGVISLSR